MTKKIFTIPLYYGKLTVYIVEDWNYLIKKHKLNFPCKPENAGGCVFPDGQDVVIVIIKSQICPVVLAHETVHVVNEIYKCRGIQLDTENDEPQAYLTGWVFDKVFRTVYPDFKI